MFTTNNEKENKVASSFGNQYYGKDSKEQKALSTKFYGECIVIGIHRLLAEKDQTTNAKYDYKNGTSVFMTAKNAKLLSKLLTKAMEARDEAKSFKAKGVPGKNNLIEVALGNKYGCDADKVCIAIYAVEDKRAKSIDVFEFKEDLVITDYDPENGTYEHQVNSTDLEYLILQLEEFAKGMSNGFVHAHKRDLKYSMDRIIGRQVQMMDALGIKNNAAVSKTDWSSNTGSSSNEGNKTFSKNADDLEKELASLYN